MKRHSSVRIILLNSKNELLLMCADDPKTTTLKGKYNGRFWYTVGGQIEDGESIEQAALREIYEETGIKREKVVLGPVVWFGEFDLILSGIATRLKQVFIVARTAENNFTLKNLTAEEQAVVQRLDWFSLQRIQTSTEVVYPVLLPKYLPDVIAGNYPEKPIEIDLGKQP